MCLRLTTSFFDGSYHLFLQATEFHGILKDAWPEFAHLNMVGMMLQLICLAVGHRKQHVESCTSAPFLDVAEFCAGEAEITKAALRCGMQAQAFDTLFSPNHNMLSPRGFRRWVCTLLCMPRASLAWFRIK